ncbi:hypothetical protein GCM10009738_66660 [Kitasatospora viridis]|uniref:Uncharacterized protein n=2 Tax=Kitasatospora viridis TaxID=281105 RepID=A0A561SA95_9ACTN|nr:hypothetical protein FHX73_18163 [Kitasatospora viridis]
MLRKTGAGSVISRDDSQPDPPLAKSAGLTDEQRRVLLEEEPTEE